jgi:hypothetical protein
MSNLGNQELVDDPCTSIPSKYNPRTNPSYTWSPFHTYIHTLEQARLRLSGPGLVLRSTACPKNVRRYPLQDSVAPCELNADNQEHRSNSLTPNISVLPGRTKKIIKIESPNRICPFADLAKGQKVTL